MQRIILEGCWIRYVIIEIKKKTKNEHQIMEISAIVYHNSALKWLINSINTV